MFNVISIGKAPAERPCFLKQENMPNRKSRLIASANTSNDFSITVDGSTVDRTSFEEFKNLFSDTYMDVLQIKNKDTGAILMSYSKAILANDSFLEDIADGKGTNVILTFNCINEN